MSTYSSYRFWMMVLLTSLVGLFCQGQSCVSGLPSVGLFKDSDFKGTWVSDSGSSDDLEITMDGSGEITELRGDISLPFNLGKMQFTNSLTGEFEVLGPFNIEITQGQMEITKRAFTLDQLLPGGSSRKFTKK